MNIFELVKQLRAQRMKMVQTVDQYVFLYTSGLELIEAKRQPQGKFLEKSFIVRVFISFLCIPKFSTTSHCI